jgi:hypothetical protein
VGKYSKINSFRVIGHFNSILLFPIKDEAPKQKLEHFKAESLFLGWWGNKEK